MTTFRPFDAFALPQAPLTNLSRRVEYQEKALAQARADLAAAKSRTSVEDDDGEKERIAKLEREATLSERARILSILKSPVALRHPRIAKRVALESDSPAHEAIAALEQYEREAAANSAKANADLIVLAGRMRRGEVAAPVAAGPKTFVETTAEGIIKAGKKARGEV